MKSKGGKGRRRDRDRKRRVEMAGKGGCGQKTVGLVAQPGGAAQLKAKGRSRWAEPASG